MIGRSLWEVFYINVLALNFITENSVHTVAIFGEEAKYCFSMYFINNFINNIVNNDR